MPYQSSRNLSRLLLQSGEARANAELQRGAIWGNAIQNIGNIAGKTLTSLLEERQNAPIRAMERENITLKNQALKGEAQASGMARQIQGSALKQTEDGAWTYDRDLIAREFQRNGIADRLPGVMEGLDAFDASARTVNQAKREGLAGLAYGVTQLGNTPQAFNQAIDLALKNGFITRSDVGPILQQVGDDPAKIGEVVTQLASLSPTFAAKLGPANEEYTLSPGQKRFRGSQEIAGVAPNPINVPGVGLVAPNTSRSQGARVDGTQKGDGFLGALQRPDGSVSSEISIGVNINGREVEIPTLVPTLSKQEQDFLIQNDISDPSQIPDSIIQKAIAHAEQRIAQGKSPFADQNESPRGGNSGYQVVMPSQPSKPAVGSFEDFVVSKYGARPTPEQITEGRKIYQQADDRPIVVNPGRQGLTPNMEANVIRQLATQWAAASKPSKELQRQVEIMDEGIKAARAGNLNAGGQAVLVTFQKILDPTSVVRESEFDRSREGQSLMQRAKGAYERMTEGGPGVPLDELEKYAALARQIAEAQKSSRLTTQKDRIGRVADRYTIPRELVFEAEPMAEPPPPATGGWTDLGGGIKVREKP